MGKGWTELVISGRKRWKDNRSILRNKKLVANIASNSFYDSDENDCRFVTEVEIVICSENVWSLKRL